MYKIVPWSLDLDLSKFYATAESKGFTNNSSQKMLVDSLSKEKEWSVWILYYNDTAVGSVAAHSFEEMGPNSYRIAARTCVFSQMIPIRSLRTKNQIVTHQNVTCQFLIPTCIKWAPIGSKLYITSNDSKIGTQRLVHRIFGPAMEESGQMKRIKDTWYRGILQTIWELYPDKFLETLDYYGRWTDK
jgi:hypothetical protein